MHILFIDPLEKLVISKDSTLMLALQLQKRGEEVRLLFEKDFFFENSDFEHKLKVYSFTGEFKKNSFYLESFELQESEFYQLDKHTTMHMRIDPPFDTRYLRYLWMLDALKSSGMKVINDPRGIMLHNEKLYAYQRKEGSLPTFVGSSLEGFLQFTEELKKSGDEFLILKPLDLFQGIGVEKIGLNQKNLSEVFKSKIKEFEGAIVAQAYAKSVEQGEIRTIFFKGKELGSILKVPKKGDYLANIAQGASYHQVKLSNQQRDLCENVAEDLASYGVPWLAFDLLGDSLSEVNITCPGLLVEVAEAVGENLADQIVELL